LFGEKGYERTSVDDIARRARLPVGTFYQHFSSKRQLLLALMDELLERLSLLDLRPRATGHVRAALHDLLSAAFSTDLRFLGACRAWREASLSDPELARQQRDIQAWTTGRLIALFKQLQKMPGARRGVAIPALARAMDSFFWNLLAHAVQMPKTELNEWIDTSTHLLFHSLFVDAMKKGDTP
jgi:AcrR family transcriptional regulator